MDYSDMVVLVTGANRGLGSAFVSALAELGAKHVYASARHPEGPQSSRITPVPLDVTDRTQVAALAQSLPDVTMVINNAGIHRRASLFDADVVDIVDVVSRTNLLGTLAVSAAFAPVITANGGGVIANVLSAGSWLAGPGNLAYATSKAAALSLTNNMRAELNPRGVQVTAIHAGFIDTDMMATFPGPKLSPRAVADAALAAIAAGSQEVLVDGMSQKAKSASALAVARFAD
ncbi:SDR family NAD(P)-dependent oxidoreductase [Humibacter albus]|uniref:SDR family NAD(P)-dependent oxidoreductase n=1 Tax=Humibacter albus TaxID=427754 RepID=UPI0003B50C9E|nr:SDR family NAD(P)-dependent oxidoreductase [Humibacter albus]